MKTIKNIIVLLVTAITIQACGGSASAPSTNGSVASTEATTSAPAKVSAEMEAFMKELNGNSENVAKALDTYGTADLDRKYMDMFNLEKAKVISADKDCYTMEAGAGMTIATYVICWEAGKIKSIEDKGVK